MESLPDQDSISGDILEEPNKPIQNETDSSSMVTLEESKIGSTAEDTTRRLENGSSMAALQDNSKDDMPNNVTVERDSGMASPQDSSKDVTPEKPNKPIVNDGTDDEDIEDETLGERLWGLTEMFPESLVNGSCCMVYGTKSGVKSLYNLTRSVMWIFFSSSVILVAPLIIEVERAQILESQRSQEKQILLGSNAAMSSNLGPNMAMIPTR